MIPVRLHVIKINQNAEQSEYSLKLQKVFLNFQLFINGKNAMKL